MKEYFDVLDENRVHLGYTKERGEKLLANEYNMGVENYIICDNRILMTQRSNKKSHAGMWEVPGGCSQSGEESFDSLKREMLEEIGLNIDESMVKLIATKIYKQQFVDIYQTIISINIADIRKQDEEISDVKLVDKDEFYRMVENNQIVSSVIKRFKDIKDRLEINW